MLPFFQPDGVVRVASLIERGIEENFLDEKFVY